METDATRGSGRNLLLATLAFAVCFSAWGFLAPIAPAIQDDLGLSDTQTSIMISIPVILGSLLRIPLGLITDRVGGRVVFTGMLFYSAGCRCSARSCSTRSTSSRPTGSPSRPS